MKTKHDRNAAGCWMLSALCIASVLQFGDVLCAAVTENTEPLTWATPLKYGAVVSNAASGTVYVTFAARSASTPPSAIGVDVVSGGDPSTTPFAGNYFSAGISNIAFKICAQVSTNVSISAVLGGGYSGITWVKRLTPAGEIGVWQTKTAYIGSNAGWEDGRDIGALPKAADLWSNDIRNVKFAGVRIEPLGTNAHALTIDSFILVGADFASNPAYLVNLGDDLEKRFGVRRYADLTAAQKAVDSDRDGMSDANEILAGTKPDDPNSVFAAEMVTSKADGITIRWPCVESCVYTVSRTSDLVGGQFTAVANGYRLTATSTGYMEFTDTTVSPAVGPYFYRVVKE